jgi:RNA polymerase sigma-70 factor, ECF subfamily
MTIENFIKENQIKIRQIIGNFADYETAKDIEQDVYFKIWKTSAHKKPMGYIKTVVVNTCKDFLKSKHYKRSQITSSDENELLTLRDKRENPLQRTERIFRQKTIINAINNLPPKLKEVIILYDIEELDQNKIAQKLNCPIGTVKSRLFNARKQLQADLTKLIEGDLL